MKTLIIHPFDETTEFLKIIYFNKGYEVISHNISSGRLKEQIKSHDRIIMLGHGNSDGLFGFNRFIISSKLVYLLREKICVCIWCNAQSFVDKYKLKGFYTGMFISDDEEANLYSVNSSVDEINESNNAFSHSVGLYLNSPNMLVNVKKIYDLNTNVGIYNKRRIYCNLL